MLNALIKTISDYALMLEHCGIPKEECMRIASRSKGEPLFQELLKRNIELFKELLK